MSEKRTRELVINLTSMQQHVTVISPDGTKTSVNIMPRKRVELDEGYKTCSNWQAHNPKALKVHSANTGEDTSTVEDTQAASADPEVENDKE